MSKTLPSLDRIITLLDKRGSVLSKEGGLFVGEKRMMDARAGQTKFLRSIISEVKPERVIEIGTHRAYFGAFLLNEFDIKEFVTFGLDAKSEGNIQILREEFSKTKIRFIFGDSKTTFTSFMPEHRFQLAWIDGGHTPDIIASDLRNCARLGIKHILVDDVRSGFPEIPFAIKDFNEQYGYKVRSYSDYKNDWKGIAYLRAVN